VFLPNMLSWPKSGVMIQTIYYTISVTFIVLGLFFCLRFMEYAIIVDGRIIISCPLGKITSFKSDEIKSIKVESLITYASRGYIYKHWIVIKTESTYFKKGGLNKKRNRFCTIICSPTNKFVLKQYADYYHIPFE